MTYCLLLDENVEHELVNRLTVDGHDVEHVEFITALGKGAADDEIACYSGETGRLVVTYDDDFVLRVDERTFRAVLYVADSSLGEDELASAINRMSEQYPQPEVTGVEYLDRWILSWRSLYPTDLKTTFVLGRPRLKG